MAKLDQDTLLLAVLAAAGAGAAGASAIAGSEILGCIGIGLSLPALFLSVRAFFITQRRSDLASNGESSESADSVALRHLELLTRGGPKPLIDPETSLPDDRYFELALEGRVAAARRHLWPVTLVVVQIALDPVASADPQIRKDALARFSLLLQGTMRESDVLCRLDATTFALLLDDTAEEGGVWSAERLQVEASRQHPIITKLVAGVASYPSHGLDATKVHNAARAALTRALANESGHGLGTVEVAHVDH